MPTAGSETEVTAVAKTLGSAGDKVFIGRAASKRMFKVLAPTYATIHLATHGVLDNRHTLYSHLLLTKTEGDPENDGLLEAREIMNMKLNADLAALSACETANGRIAPGEEVMGMSWAFFAAGTRSMLVSQWKVNAASTYQLMVNFYHSLEASRSHSDGNRAKALRARSFPINEKPALPASILLGWVCDDREWDVELGDREKVATGSPPTQSDPHQTVCGRLHPFTVTLGSNLPTGFQICGTQMYLGHTFLAHSFIGWM